MILTRRKGSRRLKATGGMTRRQLLAAAIAVVGVIMLVRACGPTSAAVFWQVAPGDNGNYWAQWLNLFAVSGVVGAALILGSGRLAAIAEAPGMALPGADPARVRDTCIRLTGLTMAAMNLPAVGRWAIGSIQTYYAPWGTDGGLLSQESRLVAYAVIVAAGLWLALRKPRTKETAPPDPSPLPVSEEGS